jgi:membrane protein YqaA with SNARE-associated domain
MAPAAELAALFAVSFLAATILPAQSEVVLAGMVVAERVPVWLLVAVASAGNVLGSLANWILGRVIARGGERLRLPIRRNSMARAEAWYRRWGKWSLLLSWAPVIGDPLTVVAGILREPLLTFCVLVTVAKVGRYLVVAHLAQGAIGTLHP